MWTEPSPTLQICVQMIIEKIPSKLEVAPPPKCGLGEWVIPLRLLRLLEHLAVLKIRWEVLFKTNNLLRDLCATRCWWRNEWKMLASFTCVLLGQLASQPMNAISPKSLFPCVPHHKYTNMQQAIVGESQGRCNQKYFSCNTSFL